MTRITRRAAILAATVLPRAVSAAPLRARLYKELQCGCCQGHANYLRASGFEVAMTPTDDLDKISRQAGIPDALQGCSLTMLDGYAVSGHVPVEAVRKPLAERPMLAAITPSRMPSGSPPTAGRKTAPFMVYTIPTDGGAPSSFAVL
jgi:hypothetical protein